MSTPPDPAMEIAQLERRLHEIDGEREQITTRLGELRRQLAAAPTIAIGRPGTPRTPAPAPTSSSEKVALFSSLFRGRADVYPRFWTNERKGTKGYSPACLNEWQRPICQKPKVRCGECHHQAFEAVSSRVLTCWRSRSTRESPS